MKRTLLLATIFSIFTSINAFAETSPTLDQIKKTETIRIGYRESEPPMSFLSEDKQPVGYTIDLCAQIVQAVKSKLKNPNIATKYVASRESIIGDLKREGFSPVDEWMTPVGGGMLQVLCT